MIRYFVIAFLLLSPSILNAQKKSFEEKLFFTIGLGASEIKSTFGTDPNSWTTRFSYRFGMGYSISDRLGLGLMGSVFVLNGSNGIYLPGKNSVITISPETKGERFILIGLNARVIPISSLKAMSLGIEFGLCGYQLIDNKEYSGSGPGYGITLAYNLTRKENIRIEPYFFFSGASLSNKTIQDELVTGRSYLSYSLGLQVVLHK
jgi:hypothetical protein